MHGASPSHSHTGAVLSHTMRTVRSGDAAYVTGHDVGVLAPAVADDTMRVRSLQGGFTSFRDAQMSDMVDAGRSHAVWELTRPMAERENRRTSVLMLCIIYLFTRTVMKKIM